MRVFSSPVAIAESTSTTPDIGAGQLKAAQLDGKEAIYDGPRCYSAVSFWHGMIGGPINISSKFMKMWMQSPLVKPIDGSKLQPGDIRLGIEKD